MTESHDLLRFLDPWTLLLPEGGSRVLAAVGSGGKSALLGRILHHYRDEGLTVLWTQTVAHAAPPDLHWLPSDAPLPELRDHLAGEGALFVAGPPDERSLHGPTLPSRIEELRRRLEPDIVLVEAQAPCGTPLRADGVAPLWPEIVHLVFPVVGLQGVGMLWGPRSVAGEEFAVGDGEEPRRVTSEDALRTLMAEDGLLAYIPPGLPILPFLAGFGAFRDVDGMFALVSELWEDERLRAVLLGELIGSARVDAAERAQAADSPTGAAHLEGERVYALYPAHLDDEA